jgi:hypothetical protein
LKNDEEEFSFQKLTYSKMLKGKLATVMANGGVGDDEGSVKGEELEYSFHERILKQVCANF